MPSDTHPSTPAPLEFVLEECARTLPDLLPRLSRVIKDREEDFLQLGTHVFGINSKAGRFSSAARDMASSVGGGALQGAIAELNSRAAEAKAIFASVSSDEHLQGMTEVLGLIRSLEQAMLQFSNMIRTLKVLEITTRIESARLGSAGAGFTTLADDVRSLTTTIADHAAKIEDQSKRLSAQVSGALERGRSQIATRERTVEEIFRTLFFGISELEMMREGSSGLVEELAIGSRQAADSMGHIIASVQFHDITRQQVEHVEEILVQALEEISARPQGGDILGLSAWVRDVLRLQAPHLSQAEETFHQAVEDFISNLNSIGSSIGALHGKITDMAYAGQGGGVSVLDTISRQIAQVTEAMRTTGEHVAETSRTMSGMAETISMVSTFVQGIEDIGAEIELIALNARVKATHTGDMGRTLAVIAMEIQNLSVDTRTRTGQIADILHDISSLADRLAELARSSDVSDMVEGIQERFEGVLNRLAGLDDELARNVGNLSGLSSELINEIRGLTSSITFHEPVSAQLRDLEQAMSDMAGGFSPFSRELEAARQPEKLREQLSRYTMDSERLIHLAVLGHHDDVHIAAQGPSDSPDVELFGDDNIELFGDDNVELFDAPSPVEQPGKVGQDAGDDEDLGDNVELF